MVLVDVDLTAELQTCCEFSF